MTAKDLRLGVDGIQVTPFEGRRRMRPEVAQQQCTCGVYCYSDCRYDCGGECDSECWDQCNWDEIKQATMVSTPHARTSSQVNVAVRNENLVYEQLY